MYSFFFFFFVFFFFQAEDGIRYLVRSRGLGDVYKRQVGHLGAVLRGPRRAVHERHPGGRAIPRPARLCDRGAEPATAGRPVPGRLSLIHI